MTTYAPKELYPEKHPEINIKAASYPDSETLARLVAEILQREPVRRRELQRVYVIEPSRKKGDMRHVLVWLKIFAVAVVLYLLLLAAAVRWA